MTAPQSITQELQKVAPSAIIELFELRLVQDLHGSADIYRFHAGVNGKGDGGNIVWAGSTYSAYPVECEGFEYSGNGQLPRPRLRVANVLSTITTVLLAVNAITPGNDLIGAKVIRRRTLARYLDAANFPARRNLFTNTNLFAWTESGTAAADQVRWRQPNVVLAPDGTQTATKLAVSTDSDLQRIYVSTSGVTANSPVTFSVYAKAGEYSRVSLRASAVATANAIFDLETGQWVVNSNATAQFAEDAGNGWWRIGITYTPTTTSTVPWVQIADSSNALTFTGDGESGLYLWGAQLEVNSTPTAYQPVGATWSQNPYGTPDPTAEFPQEIYFISRKIAETRDMVEFELAAAFDLQGVRAPKRQCIANVCQWAYRSVECGYTGRPVADEQDKPAKKPASALANDFYAADDAAVAAEATLNAATAALNTAKNNLNAAQPSWKFAEARYDSNNQCGYAFGGAQFARWNGADVTIGQQYRVGGVRINAFYYTVFEIQRWVYDTSAVTAAQSAYNTALANYNTAKSNYSTAAAARTTAYNAWYASPQFAIDMAYSGDACGKRVSSCKLRFGGSEPLPFGSFPGVGSYTL